MNWKYLATFAAGVVVGAGGLYLVLVVRILATMS